VKFLVATTSEKILRLSILGMIVFALTVYEWG
jgi:hypothetical protein